MSASSTAAASDVARDTRRRRQKEAWPTFKTPSQGLPQTHLFVFSTHDEGRVRKLSLPRFRPHLLFIVSSTLTLLLSTTSLFFVPHLLRHVPLVHIARHCESYSKFITQKDNGYISQICGQETLSRETTNVCDAESVAGLIKGVMKGVLVVEKRIDEVSLLCPSRLNLNYESSSTITRL
jgi:hypothetical protein